MRSGRTRSRTRLVTSTNLNSRLKLISRKNSESERCLWTRAVTNNGLHASIIKVLIQIIFFRCTASNFRKRIRITSDITNLFGIFARATNEHRASKNDQTKFTHAEVCHKLVTPNRFSLIQNPPMTPYGIDWGWVQTRRLEATGNPSRSRRSRTVVVGGGVQ